ncbi:bacteriophage tail fiber protein [Yersinia aldovae]|uniref:gp53-like domain-containing protein n=1 Tax=Yersinia aldovae TaxID=29483 RepID=UPI0005E8302E|nr:hypothetical protein [Yersinia aldovae]CNJ07559.1 bacteriophage tail fiber protein [Yersinia aldovae]
MHRIDTPSAQIDKFGAGKNGFTRGNPQPCVPATALDDDYFDAVQEELAGIVEAASIILNKTNRAQVLAALKKLFLQSGNNLSEIKSAGATAVAATLANLGLKEAAKRDVGTGVNQIPDMSAFSTIKGENGSFYLPGGIIVKWGQVNSTGKGGDLTLPTPFPTALCAVLMCHASASDLSSFYAGVGGGTRYGFRFSTAPNTTTGTSFYYMAIGY